MAQVTTRHSQFPQNLRRITNYARQPSLSPARLQTSWDLRQQPIENVYHNLAPNGPIVLTPSYNKTVLSPLSNASEDEGRKVNFPPSDKDTGHGQGSTEWGDQPEGLSDRDKLIGGGMAGGSVPKSTASLFRMEDFISKYLLAFPLGATTVTNGTPHSSSAPGKRAARATKTPRTAVAGQSKAPRAQKRPRLPDDDGDDGEDDPKRNRKRQSGCRVEALQIKYYVCPYQLQAPPIGALPGTPETCAKGIKPGRLREHLRRHHLRPVQCSNCGRRGDSGQIKDHRERGTCHRRSDIIKVPQEILTIDEQLTIQPKTTWEELWVLLFGPDVPLPHENDRYIRTCQPQGIEEVIDALVYWLGPTLIQAFLRSEAFQRLQTSESFSWATEELVDGQEVANPQMDFVVSIIEDANRERRCPQTRSNILAAGEELPFIQAPSNTNMDPNQDTTAHEELPGGLHPAITDIPNARDVTDTYPTPTWAGRSGKPLETWSYEVPAVAPASSGDAPNEDQARAWVASFDRP